MRGFLLYRIFGITLALVVVALFSTASLAVETSQSHVAKGDMYYAKRADGHRDDMAAVNIIMSAIDEYKLAYEMGDHSSELVEKTMRANFFYATYAETDKDKQKAAFEHSIKIAEEFLKDDPDNVAINYQISGAWGRWGEVNGIIASARKGVADRVKEYGEKTVAFDADFGDGGGYRTLGRLHLMVPRIPFILSWPSNKESEKYLAKAVKVGPDNLTNHLFYAETLYENGSYVKAMEEVNIVLRNGARSDYLVEDLRDQSDARKLKEKINKKL